MKTLKERIKEAAETQRQLKNQRRTERLIGLRIMQPWEAAYRHFDNKEQLRILYAAYGLLRGKPFHVTENCYAEENHPLNQFKNAINDIVEQYKKQFVRSDEQAA